MANTEQISNESNARFALYFSPASDSHLCRFGQCVLGRTASESRTSSAETSFTHRERWQEITSVPAHYGFHATLKAPFELKANFTESQLLKSAEEFASRQSAIQLTGLAPRLLAKFLALTVSEQSDELSKFAFSCVHALEEFREPLSQADIERRKARGLNKRQEALLYEFGYPFIDDEFRFHMTLSGKLDKSDSDFELWVNEIFKQCVPEDPMLDQVSIFKQANRATPFVQIAEFPFPN